MILNDKPYTRAKWVIEHSTQIFLNRFWTYSLHRKTIKLSGGLRNKLDKKFGSN